MNILIVHMNKTDAHSICSKLLLAISNGIQITQSTVRRQRKLVVVLVAAAHRVLPRRGRLQLVVADRLRGLGHADQCFGAAANRLELRVFAAAG